MQKTLGPGILAALSLASQPACQAVSGTEDAGVMLIGDARVGGGEQDGGGPGGAGGGFGGAGGVGGGAGGAGGGVGGAGGVGGFGGSGPDCPVPLSIELTDPDAPLMRGQGVGMALSTPGAEAPLEVRATAAPGGRVSVIEGAVRYTPGGPEAGDLPWPWWTGPVTITVELRDARGCVAETEQQVQVLGDVVVGDAQDGKLHVLGSDGVWLGLLPWAAGQHGVVALAALPASADGGGFVAATGFLGAESPYLQRFDREGLAVGEPFETTDLGGQPLFDNNRAPRSLHYDTRTGEILADQGVDSLIHRWRMDGVYVGGWPVPFDGQGTAAVVGFGRLGDDLVVGHEQHNDLYRIAADGTATRLASARQGQVDDMWMVTSLGTDSVFAIMSVGRDASVFHEFDPQGRLIGSTDLPGYLPRRLTPFADGFLSTWAFQIQTWLHDATGARVNPADVWHTREGFSWHRPNAILWLD